jgi:hypothetical protein
MQFVAYAFGLLIVVALWFDRLFGKRLILSAQALIQVYEAQLDL